MPVKAEPNPETRQPPEASRGLCGHQTEDQGPDPGKRPPEGKACPGAVPVPVPIPVPCPSEGQQEEVEDDLTCQFFASGPLWCEDGSVTHRLLELSPGHELTRDLASRAGSSKCNVLYVTQNGSPHLGLELGPDAEAAPSPQPSTSVGPSTTEEYQGYWYYISTRPESKSNDHEKRPNLSPVSVKLRKPSKSKGEFTSKSSYTTVIKPEPIRPRLATFPLSSQSINLASARTLSRNSPDYSFDTGVQFESGREYARFRSRVSTPEVSTSGACDKVKPRTLSVDNLPEVRDDLGQERRRERSAARKEIKTGSEQTSDKEPIHMTLEEVRNSLSDFRDNSSLAKAKSQRKLLPIYLSRKRDAFNGQSSSRMSINSTKIKNAFGSIFRLRKKARSPSSAAKEGEDKERERERERDEGEGKTDDPESNATAKASSPFVNRALPPLPLLNNQGDDTEPGEDAEADEEEQRKKIMDYAASIERVKDCGWYWGPISGEMAEKLLANEPDGSFIVRDSSDEHYIFSLTFKLNRLVRHVRIEHDQGNFSFGCLQKFRSNTIVDFIENAVEHSRSGRYLFFLHRRPVMGPMRVQLLHPVSRFKQIQSLQHMCRFILLKYVRRDLIDQLPLPPRLKAYLNTPYYYSEELASMENESNI